LVRLGFAGKGVLYLLIGVIAIRVAAGGGGKPEDQKGALQALRDESFGMPLLIILGIALIGYAIWGLVEAIRGPDNDGVMAVIERIGAVVRMLLYGSFAAFALMIVFAPSAATGSGQDPQETTAKVLDVPLGRWLVLALGVVILGVAAYDVYRAFSQSFLEDLDLSEANDAGRKLVGGLGSAGHGARAIAYALVGYFLAKAAIQYDPDEAVGLDGALQRLAAESYGPIVLGVVSAGLIAYGIYALAEARYHRL
jgi:hypothetical protein